MMRAESRVMNDVAKRASGFVLCPTVDAVLLDDGRLLLVPLRGEPVQVDAPWGREVHAHVVDGTPMSSALPRHERDVVAETLRSLAVRGMLLPAQRMAAARASRYQRQVSWFESAGLDGDLAQRRLAAATVLLLGLDCFGAGVADLLSRAGVGSLVLADDARIAAPDLSVSHLFDRGDVGVRRAAAAAQHLELANDHTRLVGLDASVDSADALSSVMRRHRPDVVVVSHACLQEESIAWLDAVAFAAGVPVLYGGTSSSCATVGPLLVAHSTPCHACYHAATEGVELDGGAPLGPNVAWSDAAAASLACAQVIAQLVGDEPPAVLGRELRFDPMQLAPTWVALSRIRRSCSTVGCTS